MATHSRVVAEKCQKEFDRTVKTAKSVIGPRHFPRITISLFESDENIQHPDIPFLFSQYTQIIDG